MYCILISLTTLELPVCSPLVHASLRSLCKWQESIWKNLELFGDISPDFIPGCFIDSDAKGPPIHKYRTLLEKQNTPFIQNSCAAPCRRLWNYLVRQEVAQEIFIKAIFIKRKKTCKDNISSPVSNDAYSIDEPRNKSVNIPEPVRIIHKDQESILAFCLNRVNSGLLALATPKELQEIDVSLLFDSPNWLEDECEIDILNLNKDIETLPSSGFLVIQTPNDK